MPIPDGPVRAGASASSQLGERVGRRAGLLDVRPEPGRSGAGEAGAEALQLGALRAHAAGAVDPEVLPGSDQVLPRLGEERRDRLERGPDRGHARRVERQRVLPELEAPARVVPLARRLIALRAEDRDVERGVVGPRPQHAVIEVEAVHLRADDVVVDLLRDRPGRGLDGGEPIPIGAELAVLGGHRGRPVIRDAVDQDRRLEAAPVREEPEKIGVGGHGVASPTRAATYRASCQIAFSR